MHRDNLAFVTMTPFTDFLITTSVEGVVKFWKKMAVGIEFVKMFRAHQGEIVSVSVSTDGRSFATAGTDKRVAIFDVVTFGTLAFCCWRALRLGWDLYWFVFRNRSLDHGHPSKRPEVHLLGT